MPSTRKTLVRQLFLPIGLTLFAASGVAGWFSLNSLKQSFYDEARRDLQVRAEIVRPHFASRLNSANVSKLQPLCREIAETARARLTVVLPDGQVLCDSHEDPARMDNHASRKEFDRALKNEAGFAIRSENRSGKPMMFVAVPVVVDGPVRGAVRVSRPMSEIDSTLQGVGRPLILAGALFALTAVALLYYFSRRIIGNIKEIQSGAERFTEGDFSFRLPLPVVSEFNSLSRTLNHMAVQLDDRIRTITEQRNEQQAILTSMVEGVFAIDRDETVIHMNEAAGRLFGVDPRFAQNKPLQAVVRNTRLLAFVTQSLESRDLQETDIELDWEGQVRYLQTRGTVLRNTHKESIGAVFVLYDVTRLRKLETMRRDFVANVSHELKTPITSIKGFVETLLDGALESPEDARRFLGIVSKQAERLNAIIEDLLSLSRIEQDSDTGAIVTQECHLREVLENAIGDCAPKATQKGIRIDLDCAKELIANVNPPLLEEAVVNLVDNAIKYSDPEKRILISAAQSSGAMTIQVRDEGKGIDQQYLPRLFERFYRVDKARSRQMGGTGLGLAIVKHIVQAHGGSVEVASTPGVGSIFSINLPKNK